MQKLTVGDVIYHAGRNLKVRVQTVVRRPQDEVDGVPHTVLGHVVPSGDNIGIYFGKVGSLSQQEDWHFWRVVERRDN